MMTVPMDTSLSPSSKELAQRLYKKGTASVVLVGLVAALKLVGETLAEHTFLFLGAGEAGTGIAELIALEMSKQTKAPLEETRKKIWLVDSKGLIVRSRKESLEHFKKPWAHEHEPVGNLLDAIKAIKPTVLIGSSGVGKTFTKEVVLEAMTSFNEGKKTTTGSRQTTTGRRQTTTGSRQTTTGSRLYMPSPSQSIISTRPNSGGILSIITMRWMPDGTSQYRISQSDAAALFTVPVTMASHSIQGQSTAIPSTQQSQTELMMRSMQSQSQTRDRHSQL